MLGGILKQQGFYVVEVFCGPNSICVSHRKAPEFSCWAAGSASQFLAEAVLASHVTRAVLPYSSSVMSAMSRSYYLDLFTGQTWQRFLEAGGKVSGFRGSKWSMVQKLKRGDQFICYLTGASRFIGLLEITSEPFFDETPIWDVDVFPARVGVKPVITLSPETGVPVLDLRDSLSWFKDMKSATGWTGHVRSSPARMNPADAELIIAAMTKAELDPVHRPVDPRKLKRVPVYTTKLGKDEEVVTVPEDEPEIAEPLPAQPSAAPAVTHEEIQWLLLKLGSDMGLDVWIARNDKGRDFNGKRFQDIRGVRSELPRQFDDATNRTIELIDVIWLHRNTFVAAFEVEHTTAVYSGLLRMADLVAMQPNLSIPLYLVAPDDRREKVMSEVNRPVFSRMSPPLNRVCQYIPYSQLRGFVDRIGDFARHLKPEALNEIAEVCAPSA